MIFCATLYTGLCMIRAMLRATFFILAISFCSAFAGSPLDDWAGITKLDAGPGVVPKTEAEANRAAVAHNEQQEKSLRAFIAAHPKDPNFFEAKLRLARAMNIRARLIGEPEPAEVGRLLDELETIATGPQRAELEYARLSRQMRRLQGERPSAERRNSLLEAARKFQKSYPEDRRLAAVLAEVATLFESDPKTKAALVSDAEKLAKEPELKAQLADDRRRLALVNKPLGLHFPGIDGSKFDIKTQRGKVVVVMFFATWSAPSRAAFPELKARLGDNDAVKWVGISLDKEKAPLTAFLQQQKTPITVGWDGQIWDSPLIRSLGINSLPTVWIFDKQGVLRSLDGLEETAKQISRLSAE